MKNLFALSLPILLSACASGSLPLPSDNLIAPGFRPPQSGALILLLPARVEAYDLQPGVDALKSELHRQLSAAGYKVIALDENSYDTIWSQEVAEVGGVYDAATGALRRHEFALAEGHLVQRVSSETKAALVVEPQLVLRKAEVSGVSAVWDGQQRRAMVVGGGGDDYRHDGLTLGLSVGLRMFAASGEFVSRTYGGVSLPYRINVRTSSNEVRPDLFANDKDIADGVSLALSPFLGTKR